MKGALRPVLFFGVVSVLTAMTAEAAGPYQFYSVTPCRLVNTRNGTAGVNGPPALSSGVARNFQITNLCGVPDTATAATLNVTFITPTADGFIKIWPYNTTMPGVSTVNAATGEPAIANGAIVPLTAGSLNISVVYGSQVVGSTANVIIDVTGYFQ
ncbi:MAG TPA: hypothetical protein VMR54_01800 [Thermoanaerobaculia bacterium]|nr:hypothetical protein [Thermoanaerobaculia bacterium]